MVIHLCLVAVLSFDDLNFSNINIWQKNGSGFTSFTASDGNLFTNATFTDINIEDEGANRIMEFLTYKNPGFGRGRVVELTMFISRISATLAANWV